MSSAPTGPLDDADESSPRPDRAAAVRGALRSLVAERGFHGTSMSAVAARAGVATGTAYVHYASKDDLVLAAYREAKRQLGQAAVAAIVGDPGPEERFLQLWRGLHDHLAEDPDRARFLVQFDASPYAARALEVAVADDDVLFAEATRPDLAARLAPLPLEVLYDLGFGPAVRLAAHELPLDAAGRDLLARACWRAVTATP